MLDNEDLLYFSLNGNFSMYMYKKDILFGVIGINIDKENSLRFLKRLIEIKNGLNNDISNLI